MRTMPLVLLTVACGTQQQREDITPHASLVAEHAQHLPSNQLPPVPLRQPGDSPDVVVYGYWPYWGDPISTVPIDQLTHLAIFDVAMNADGSLGSTATWTNNAPTALALAQPYGVKVHLTVTAFSDAVMNNLLPSPSRRATAIANLAAQVNAVGAHGVNVDFEGMDASRRQDFNNFIIELNRAVDEVFIALPPIDWSNAYDYGTLAANSHGLFIMGYNYHWSSGDPGPNAPLYGGSPWAQWSLDWSVNDYRSAGAPDSKIIMGMPLYGYDWPSTSTAVPGNATGRADAVFYSEAGTTAATYGRRYDSLTESPYTFPSSTRQLWYEDAVSVEAKVAYAVDEGLQGLGFWALTYDDNDPDLWQRIDALTHGAEPDDGILIDSNTTSNPAGTDLVVSNSWQVSTSPAGFWNTGYYAGPGQPGADDDAVFSFSLAAPACMEAQAWWPARNNASAAAPWKFYNASGTWMGTVEVNQNSNAGQWVPIATREFTAGWNEVALSRDVASGTWVLADALRLLPSENCPVDSDNDGVPNEADSCPSDPGKVDPGTCGCGVADVDSDGDGMANCLDLCPVDADKTDPGVCGCGEPDIDGNGDGIIDCGADSCPADPNKLVPGVCGCGVPDVDGDGDGTMDCFDGCPTDAGKTVPGACGCGTVDADSDGDGAWDCHDGCPTDAAKTVPGVCGCGVADVDANGDGYYDCLSQCGNGTVDAGETCDDGNTVGGDGCTAQCSVESLVFDAVVPSRVGLPNTLTVRGATPGRPVYFLVSTQVGATTVPGCPSTQVPLRAPTLVATATANSAGQASWTGTPPAHLAGRTFGFVGVELTSCRASNSRMVTFQP